MPEITSSLEKTSAVLRCDRPAVSAPGRSQKLREHTLHACGGSEVPANPHFPLSASQKVEDGGQWARTPCLLSPGEVAWRLRAPPRPSTSTCRGCALGEADAGREPHRDVAPPTPNPGVPNSWALGAEKCAQESRSQCPGHCPSGGS